MHMRMNNLDWNLIRAFHATAATGSLSAAARQLRLTQPTLSRQVAALEEELDVTLFERIGRRLVLSETGKSLLELTETMSNAASAVALTAKGQEQEIEGPVSVSATDSFAQYLLPDMIERLRMVAPQISVTVMVSNAQSDLHRGEADIAIRHARPKREGLVGTYLRDSEAFFYAAEDWVQRHGLPESPGEFDARALIGFDDLDRYAAFLRSLGFSISAPDFRLASDSSMVIWDLVKQGLGVAPMHREIAERTAGIVRLFPGMPAIGSPIWLVTHERLQTSPRIRLVQKVFKDVLG